MWGPQRAPILVQEVSGSSHGWGSQGAWGHTLFLEGQMSCTEKNELEFT